MDKEISPATSVKFYALGVVCLLTPTLILFCLILGDGKFLAFGSYIISSQNFVESIISFLLSSLGREFCGFLWVVTGLIWLFGGIISCFVCISNCLRKTWSHYIRVIFVCTLTGYLFSYAWIIFNPAQRQIEYALHSKISTGFSPAQVIKVLSSNNIDHDGINDKDVLKAYIPLDESMHETYIITFHFTDGKLRNFIVVLHPNWS